MLKCESQIDGFQRGTPARLSIIPQERYYHLNKNEQNLVESIRQTVQKLCTETVTIHSASNLLSESGRNFDRASHFNRGPRLTDFNPIYFGICGSQLFEFGSVFLPALAVSLPAQHDTAPSAA